MVNVILKNEDITLKAEYGDNLYTLLSNNGIIDAPCGGKGVCGKCGVTINGEFYLSCLYNIKENITVTTTAKPKIGDIVCCGYKKEIDFDKYENDMFGVSIDIGTTTLVATLINLSNGEEISSFSQLNSQKSYGQDVITRINFTADNADGLQILQHTIIADVQNLLETICKQNNITTQMIDKITVGGNTTMIHLLMGVNPISIAKAPFKPTICGAVDVKANSLGLNVSDNCRLYCLPSISSFVGGDITAGILTCNLNNRKDKTLFIDIGTNGEIVLSNNGKLCCCSCAAGPALEGMNISCGMRAAHGAIEDVFIDMDNSCINIKTIGDSTPIGVCGSGILSAIEQMNKNNLINKSGRIQNSPFTETLDNKKIFMLCKEKNIYLTQNDIRQIQLAKGAILSGIIALLNNFNLSFEDIDCIMVAGQFGAHLKADSLVGAGLLPYKWKDKIIYVGNTSQAGAYLCLMSKNQREQAEHLVCNAEYIELSTLKNYEKLFIDCLSFSEENK
ncbi:MAG: ASKHA domain-containing protein [Oscillospiraceae bacterium]